MNESNTVVSPDRTNSPTNSPGNSPTNNPSNSPTNSPTNSNQELCFKYSIHPKHRIDPAILSIITEEPDTLTQLLNAESATPALTSTPTTSQPPSQPPSQPTITTNLTTLPYTTTNYPETFIYNNIKFEVNRQIITFTDLPLQQPIILLMLALADSNAISDLESLIELSKEIKCLLSSHYNLHPLPTLLSEYTGETEPVPDSNLDLSSTYTLPETITW